MQTRHSRSPLRLTAITLGLLAAGAFASAARAQPAPGQGGGEGTAVLNNDSYLRVYFVHKTPVLVTPDGQTRPLADPTAKPPGPLPDFHSPPPPADWAGPEFDDATWDRTRSPVEPGQPEGYTYGNRVAWHAAAACSGIYLRGRFVVDDPAKVADLRLSLEYVGGAVVYVNGRELARGHLPAGELAPDSAADRYPDDLYSEPGGLFLQEIKKNPAGFDRRYRRLSGVAVPAELLRKGSNVLAIEVRRAPVNEAAAAARRVAVGGMSVVPGIWSYAELRSLNLTAASGSAVSPNVVRPTGVQVWTCAPYDTVTAFDYGEPGQPAPVELATGPNGVFSGRIVVSSDQAIRGLKVSVSDLAGSEGGGTISAGAIRVRLAVPATPATSRTPPHRFDALLETIPAEIPVGQPRPPREYYLSNGAFQGLPIERPALTAGAVAPVWLTLRVPRDARPGRYEGTIRVDADGLPPATVPLRVNVLGWVVPDAKDLRVRNLGFNSPESLARHYGVPLWSDRHFELIGRSLALAAEINSRQVLVDLSVDFYGMGGNSESVIRWIAQPDGSFGHDFTVFDRYLDTIAAAMGKPLPLRLNCWGEVRPGWKTDDSGKSVTRLDPATGKTEPMKQPDLGTPESLAFWKPVLDQVRKRLDDRGWFEATALGHNSYNAPAWPPIVAVARSIWPDGVWAYTAHNGVLSMKFATPDKGPTMPVRYSECVWTRGNLTPRGYRALLKERPAIWCWGYRGVMRDWSELTLLRGAPEGAILRGHDGIGQLGVDVFPVQGDRGRPFYLNTDRGGLGPSNSTMAILAPGPDGPVATERFEMFREGLQIAEAILYVQQAIEHGKIDGELKQQADRCLDERDDAYLWQWPSERARRDAELLELAARIAAQSSGR